MLFAAADYVQFRLKAGHYSRRFGSDLMCAAFEDRLPQQVINLMRPGNGILVGSFNNWVSWLIMYLTSSQVSHVANYLGEGKIIHVTIRGVSIDPLESLFKPKVRLLPFAFPMPEMTHGEALELFGKHVGAPYAWKHVFRKACLILLGRDWPFFRWRFFLHRPPTYSS